MVTTKMETQPHDDTDRFRSFVRATYPDLMLYALRRVEAGAADDIVFETYTVAWRKWIDPPPTDPRPWLFGIARNIVRNEVRRTGRAERFHRRLRVDGTAEPQGVDTDFSRAFASLSADEDTPLEEGLGFAIAWDKPADFIGRAALETDRHHPRTKRLIQSRLEHPDLLLLHDEPILRDGVLVGRTSSGMWSYTEDRCLAMGYVEHVDGVTKEWLDSGSFEIEVALERIPATASIRSFYDPTNARVRL